jgi:hypothetical protein
VVSFGGAPTSSCARLSAVQRLKWFSLSVTPLALVFSLLVTHNEGISGHSGKQGQICNQCHKGGTTPTVALTGPSTLMPGESAQDTFTITGGAEVRAGFNVAEDDSAADGGGFGNTGAGSDCAAHDAAGADPLQLADIAVVWAALFI